MAEKVDHVAEAATYMVRRDEDGNLLNPHLNELEGQLILKIQSEGHNSAVGEAIESAFKTELNMALGQAIAGVVKKFELE